MASSPRNSLTEKSSDSVFQALLEHRSPRHCKTLRIAHLKFMEPRGGHR